MSEQTFAEWLGAALRAQGMSQGDLAEQLGVSRHAILKWRTGRSTPMPETCAKLAKVFGVPEEEIQRLAGW